MICALDSNLTVIGLMSGTSLDGIDAALVSIDGSGTGARISFRGFRTYPYPADVRSRLLAVASPESRLAIAEISEIDFLLGGLLADAASACAVDLGIDMAEIDMVASHGQTVFHQGRAAGGAVASTLQIGEPAIIAERTGLTVVSDCRTADIAAGGEGAPLVPYFDFVFLRDAAVARAVQNIGGIANVTWLPAGCELDDVVAFDNGPGNMLIDAAVAHFTGGASCFDDDGAMASRGRVSPSLLSRLLEHPYYAERPPKTAGREQFGVGYLREILSWPQANRLSAEDTIATLTALTAESIARSYVAFLPGRVGEVILSGGGANNPVLVALIERATAAPVRRFDEFGIPGDAKEAVAFALLGSETIRGVASNVPSATGARHPALLGKITLRPR